MRKESERPERGDASYHAYDNYNKTRETLHHISSRKGVSSVKGRCPEKTTMDVGASGEDRNVHGGVHVGRMD